MRRRRLLRDVAALVAGAVGIGGADEYQQRHPTAIVHAAGLLRSAYLGDLDPAVGGTMWRLYVDVPTPLIDALAGRLTDRGRIVLIGSRTSTGAAGKSQYAASKAALDGLSRSWAIEIADLVGFLLGPSGRSITGQRIVVCAAASL